MFESFVSAESWLKIWLAAFVAVGLITGIIIGFFEARRIQPGRFKWTTFRHEAVTAAINLTVAAFTLGTLNSVLRERGLIRFQQEPAAWWVILLEFAASFVLFDTWFYWWHRLMHKEPFYKWVHKTHHRSTAPNLLTTFSENPLETFVNGSFFPALMLLATIVTGGLHVATLALIVPFNTFMGLYDHAGHEFLPRWWNKSWMTKWFITTTFHDQHHKYFSYNYGGYSPMWDYICGTARKKYETDFEKQKFRSVALVSDLDSAPADTQPSNRTLGKSLNAIGASCPRREE